MTKKIKHRQTRLPKSSPDKGYSKRSSKPPRKLRGERRDRFSDDS